MTEKHGQYKASAKIEGKFYPLQHEECVRFCQELTKSQLSVLYYLRSLAPYSNGIKVKASAVAVTFEEVQP